MAWVVFGTMSIVNDKIFKAYDIRGIYGQDFDDALAYKLGLAFTELRKNDPDYIPGQKLQFAVGADMRLSSPALKESLLRGIIDSGADAVDLGTVSTPTLYFSVGHFGYSGGLMISASHNPKQWNGFKMVRSKGLPISGETGIHWLKDKITENKFALASRPGQLSVNSDTLKEEISYALSFLSASAMKPLKIVADAANGMGSAYLKPLLSSLPVSLIPLNFEPDGTFPAHEADPLKDENLVQLQQAVINEKADLGIATDGDGDRIFFVDNQGRTINQAIIRGLLAQLFLKKKPGAKIGYDARPGKITVDLIEAAGGWPVVTRIGHSLIKEQMEKEGIFFAGESSGHFYLRGRAGCFEYPSVMIVMLLEYFSDLTTNVADHLNQFNKYFHSGEINRAVNNSEAVFKSLSEKYSDAQIDLLDGITIQYPDYWFNVRASNTEPQMRLNLEAVNPELMAQKRDEVLELIK